MFPLIASAVYPTQNFNADTAGDLEANNGGSDWSENWGATVACGLTYDISANGNMEGTKEAGGAITAGQACRRNFTAQSTDDLTIGFMVRSAQSSSANSWQPQIYIRRGTNPGVPTTHCYESGNTTVYDNTTLTSLWACSSNTNYTVQIKIKPSTEEHQEYDGTTYFPTSTTYYKLYSFGTIDYTPGLDNFQDPSENSSNATGFWDDIKNIAAVTAADSAEIDEGCWTCVLWNWLSNFV